MHRFSPILFAAILFVALLTLAFCGPAHGADAITLDQSVNGRAIVIHHPRFYMCDDYQIIHNSKDAPAAHPTWKANSTHLTCKTSDPVFDLEIPNCTPKIVTKSPGQRTLSCI